METFDNDSLKLEQDYWTVIGSSDDSTNRIRFQSRHCSASAADLIHDRCWSLLIKRAYEDWVEHMSLIVPQTYSSSCFVADLSGNWTMIGDGSDTPVDAGKYGLQQSGVVHAVTWLARNTSAFVELAHGNMRISAAVVEDCYGTAFLAIGLIYYCGDQQQLVGSRLLEWAIGYLPFVYCHAEKAKGISLVEMAHDLYSQINTDEILVEIMHRMNSLYPCAQVDFLLTQDHPGTKLPVKPLRIAESATDCCSRAFLEGQIIINRDGTGEQYEMAVPIIGKQGIYGVIHLVCRTSPFADCDMQILKALSGSAGSAFENAKLYEQSNTLVTELRLINELTKQLNQRLKLSEIFDFAHKELISIFNADYCCILQLDLDTNQFIVQSTNVPGTMDEGFDPDSGYASVLCQSKEPVIVSDYWKTTDVSSKFMTITNARSMIAVPLIVDDEVKGVILVAQLVPAYFTYDNYKLLQVLASHVGLALANAYLHSEVRRMVITDNLTGLYARHYLNEQVDLHQKKGLCGSLIIVDIDHFKTINDTYGHQTGDKILVQVSGIIKASIRDTDIAARWGGEELAIYLPQTTTEQSARVAERIRLRVEKETDPAVTVSCGVSQWNSYEEKISVEGLFYKSDMALYEAKHGQRNCVKIG